MNSFKLFVAIMIAVAVIQVYGSQQRSKEQNELHDAIYEFREDVLKPNFAGEQSIFNKILAYNLAACSIVGMEECMPNSSCAYTDQVIKFEIKLSHKVMNRSELIAIAQKLHSMPAPYNYANEPQYKKIDKICAEIILKDWNEIVAAYYRDQENQNISK